MATRSEKNRVYPLKKITNDGLRRLIASREAIDTPCDSVTLGRRISEGRVAPGADLEKRAQVVRGIMGKGQFPVPNEALDRANRRRRTKRKAPKVIQHRLPE